MNGALPGGGPGVGFNLPSGGVEIVGASTLADEARCGPITRPAPQFIPYDSGNAFASLRIR